MVPADDDSDTGFEPSRVVDPTIGDLGSPVIAPTAFSLTRAHEDRTESTVADSSSSEQTELVPLVKETRISDEATTLGDTGVESLPADFLLSSAAKHPPRFLGDYELIDEIARGGMGVVFRARQVKLNRLVALKLVRDSSLAGPSDLRRFRTEAEAVARLDHPNIVPIYEVGQTDGQPYFSMKLIEGGNLSKHIESLRDSPRLAVAMMAKVARAVQYAHQRAILHRDIKPSNILLSKIGEPYITDLGLAKRIDGCDTSQAETLSGSVMGTPAYMPPEQARGQTRNLTTAADVYSLGATLYETLTGYPPFQADSIPEILRKVVEQDPPPPRSINPALDRDLETICLKCLQKDPARRYSSAEALADDLERWLDGRPIVARRISARERVLKWVKRRPGLAGLSAALLIALLALLGSGVWFTLRLQHLLELANRGRYASDMNLARRALDDGSIYQVRNQLAAYQDGPPELTKLRGFEWFYLNQLCDPRLRVLSGHNDNVLAVSFFPDGRRLASAGMDRTIRIWDLHENKPPTVLGEHRSIIRALAVSRDGRWLASGDSAKVLRLWDLSDGSSRILEGHEASIRTAVFSPDGSKLLSSDVTGMICQWQLPSGARDCTLFHRHVETQADQPGDSRGVQVAYSPDGKKAVSGGSDEWLMVWDLVSKKPIAERRTLSNVMSFTISPDGKRVAFADQGSSVKFVGLEDLKDLAGPPRGDSTGKMKVVFSPDGRLLASISQGGVILLQDSITGQTLDLFTNRSLNILNGLDFSADSSQLASISHDSILLRRLTRSIDGRRELDTGSPIRKLSFSCDGQLIAVAGEDDRIAIWERSSGRLLRSLDGHNLSVFDLAFVPIAGDMRLCSVGGDGFVKIWNADTGQLVMPPLAGHEGAVYTLAIRPDGKQLATGGQDRTLRIWNLATGQPDLAPIELEGAVSSLAYSPDGRSIASGGMDRKVLVWSVSSGSLRLGPLHHSSAVTCLAYSPDGLTLAGGGIVPERGGGITVWESKRGEERVKIESARGVQGLSISPDSQRLATCGLDNIIQVWDISSGQETLTLNGHSQRVTSVHFAPEGLRLYSAGRDGQVKLWDGGASP